MKTIGLIGGMTWHSTLEYYRLINRGVHERLGGSHSARLILYSVDFEEIEPLQAEGRWDDLSDIMTGAARRVVAAGAELVLICANTMHKTAEAVEAAIPVPLIHIADAAAAAIHETGLRMVGLLGTRFTMEEEFYRRRLEDKHGLGVVVPDEADRELVHNVIYRELGRGIVREESRAAYKAVIGRLKDRGAEGVVLGCTEIPMLIRPGDADVPLFDTTDLHVRATVAAALGD